MEIELHAFCRCELPIGYEQGMKMLGQYSLYTGCPRGGCARLWENVPYVKDTDITQNTYIRSSTVTEIMAREKCGLLVVRRTVPVSHVVIHTLRMSILQSHS